MITRPAGVSTVVDSGPALVEQWVAGELGNSSYIVVDREAGEAVVIDPLRDVDRYLTAGNEQGWRLTTSLDTHVHNDFLSGGPNLARHCGNRLRRPRRRGHQHCGPPRWRRRRGRRRVAAAARDPLPRAHAGAPQLPAARRRRRPIALFSGGALMVGTMARPDLLGPSWTFALSRMGRDTLRRRLLTLPDELCVLPTHGGGSFCGAATSDVRVTTIGAERRDNPLATAPDLAHFLAIHAKQGRYPAYYAQMAPLNRAAEPGGSTASTVQITPVDFDAAVADGAVAIDCRPQDEFDAAHVPGSLSVPGDGPFSAWVGWVADIGTQVVLVAADAVAALEAARQLVRVGFAEPRGWLNARDWIEEGRDIAASPAAPWATSPSASSTAITSP